MPSQGRRKQIEPRTRNQRIHRNHDNGSETTDLDGHQGVLSHRGACQHHQLCGLSYFLCGFILKHFKVSHRYSLTLIQVKQKLCRLLNTEFTWIELRLGEQQLQNDQASQVFNGGQFRAISFRSLASLKVNKMAVLISNFQLLSPLKSWM